MPAGSSRGSDDVQLIDKEDGWRTRAGLGEDLPDNVCSFAEMQPFQVSLSSSEMPFRSRSQRWGNLSLASTGRTLQQKSAYCARRVRELVGKIEHFRQHIVVKVDLRPNLEATMGRVSRLFNSASSCARASSSHRSWTRDWNSLISGISSLLASQLARSQQRSCSPISVSVRPCPYTGEAASK